jgi:hypothetical protein
MTALKNILVLLLIILAFVSGRSTFREMTVGAGPRVSSGPLQGDTRELAFVANALAGTVSLLDLESLAGINTLDITPDGKQVGAARNF